MVSCFVVVGRCLWKQSRTRSGVLSESRCPPCFVALSALSLSVLVEICSGVVSKAVLRCDCVCTAVYRVLYSRKAESQAHIGEYKAVHTTSLFYAVRNFTFFHYEVFSQVCSTHNSVLS